MADEKESEKSEPTFLDKAEGLFRGLFRFIRQFLATLLSTAFSPSRIGAMLRGEGSRDAFVGPYTFISLTGFLVIKLLRWFVVFGLVAVAGIFRGCEADTPQKIDEPKIASLIVFPSAEEILLIGVPLIAAILGLSWLVRWALTRETAAAQPMFVNATCYAIGFQYLLCLPAFAVVFMLSFGELRDAHKTLQQFLLALVSFVLIAWPALSFHGLMDWKGISGSIRVSRSAFKDATAWLTSILLSCSTLALALGIAWPLAMLEYNAKYVPKPILRVSRVGPYGDLTVPPSRSIALSVSNESDESLQFTLDGAEIADSAGVRYGAKITASHSGNDYVFALKPRERGWIVVSVGEPTQSTDIIKLRRESLITLRSIGRSGEREQVSATVK